jgi:hypothetical protein
MIAAAIRERLTSPEFHPFTIVLASGERIEVRHPDSVTLASTEVRGQRVFASSLTVLETRGEQIIEHVISVPLVAKIVSEFGLNGSH